LEQEEPLRGWKNDSKAELLIKTTGCIIFIIALFLLMCIAATS
jgi:hypothetical protein